MNTSFLQPELNYLYEEMCGDASGLTFRDVRTAPFRICGLYRPETEPYLHRLPENVAEATSAGVADLQQCTAGGRIRFRTNSARIAIAAQIPGVRLRPHLTLLSGAGFDLYETTGGACVFVHAYKPSTDRFDAIVGKVTLGERKMRELTLNLPLYGKVTTLEIGLDDDAELLPPQPYAVEKPVVFYGSSITQGACASRPGMCYEAWISRRLDCDYINLGFAGNCKGEPAIVQYMAGLEMSAFVCDYDHNAPTSAHLRATHEPIYRAVRASHPDIPILLLTKPDYRFGSDDSDDRREIVMDTYRKGRAAGDRNLYFIDGASLFAGADRAECTVDGCHPNDLGFYRMADAVGTALKAALNR